MTYDEIKAAIMSLDDRDQRRLIMDVVPIIWPRACVDDACVQRMRNLVDEETIREYREQHMHHI